MAGRRGDFAIIDKQDGRREIFEADSLEEIAEKLGVKTGAIWDAEAGLDLCVVLDELEGEF